LKYSWLAGWLFILVLSACVRGETIGKQKPVTPTSSSEQTTKDVLPTNNALEHPLKDPTGTPEITSATPISEENPCREEWGSVQQFTLQIFRTEDKIRGRIYTPPCYGMDPDQVYPTLYLFHGATSADQQWDDLGVDERADQLISQGEISPLIIIMPEEKSWISFPENPFGDYIVKDLIPWVDKNYQTLADRKYRAIGGLSRGGNWAVRIGFLHWGLFGSVGAHSTPLFIGDLERIPGWFEVIPESKIPRIYLDIGVDDNDRDDAEAFGSLLSELGIAYSWNLSPGLHEKSYWQSHLDEYLIWYSTGWGVE